MSTNIKCPSCGHQLEITEALKNELEQKVLLESNAKHKQEVAQLKAEFETQQEQLAIKAKDEAIVKIRKEYDSKIISTKEEAAEAEKQNIQLQKQLTEIMKELREAKNTKQKLEVEFHKRILEEEDKIKQTAKKEAEEEINLKVLEKEKKLSDAEKQIKELQRKLQQGSQQTQGEVQELQLEEILQKEFPFDELSEVPKGIGGADVVQVVKTRAGTSCGTIVWESKNTKSWTQGWVVKLKEDQRKLKAEIAIIVTTILPPGIKDFGLVDGVWVTNLSSAISLTYALRQQLIHVQQTKQAHQGKATKAEVVYNYLIGNDFKQRIEVWVEYFNSKREEVEKEKRYFTKKWEKEDKQIFKIMQSTAGIYGDLQGLIGSALPKVQSLELPEEVE